MDYASHSAQVDAIRDRILEDLSGLVPGSGRVPFYSSVTGGLFDTAGLDAEYWFTNLRERVRFDEVVRGLGDAVFIEC
ncbi:acyltransferase domain-containing protein, partial [Streptomyces johnsoniae]